MEAAANSFFSAIKQGNLDEVEALLIQNPELTKARDSSNLSPVLVAIYYGQPAIAGRLIDHGAPLDIFEASAASRLEKVRALLDEDPSLVNAWAPDGFQPLGLACFFGHTPIVELLLSRGAQVNSPSRNSMKVQPLNSAAAGQHQGIARLLLEHGANVNARQEENFTPLHAAAQNGQAEMIYLLLEYGADSHALTTAGKAPYDYAVEAGHIELADMLK